MNSSSILDRITLPASELTEDVARLAAHVGGPVCVIASNSEEEIRRQIATDCLAGTSAAQNPILLNACVQAAQSVSYDGQALAVPLNEYSTAVFCALTTENYRTKVATLIAAPIGVARSLMQSACEATRLSRRADSLQHQLDASAMQIAQSFEEQCWLRDLARNLSISNETANANMLAQGILGPLIDLLRTEELFLLVRDEETARSGLTSCYFGAGRIGLREVSSLIQSLVQQKPTGPIVHNNAHLLSSRVHSLAAVPVLSCERPLGYIVAINRLPHLAAHSSITSDGEFGSVEVGLLEEASVLLSTQTHNIRLILDSQHLALGTLQR